MESRNYDTRNDSLPYYISYSVSTGVSGVFKEMSGRLRRGALMCKV